MRLPPSLLALSVRDYLFILFQFLVFFKKISFNSWYMCIYNLLLSDAFFKKNCYTTRICPYIEDKFLLVKGTRMGKGCPSQQIMLFFEHVQNQHLVDFFDRQGGTLHRFNIGQYKETMSNIPQNHWTSLLGIDYNPTWRFLKFSSFCFASARPLNMLAML